jgi:hypothetical protein
MKKHAFSGILIFLAGSLFAQTASDYDKILEGDLSAFTGYWVNGNNHRIYLLSDGTTGGGDSQASLFSKTEGVYNWFIKSPHEGIYLNLAPIGVAIAGIETDATRARVFYSSSNRKAPRLEYIYYRESAFPATHVTTDNLRLRGWPGLSANTITILEKGAKALIQMWGGDVTIDGLSARWAYVYTIDGLEGWCFSGYLEEIKE